MDSCLREYIAMVEMRSNAGIERRRDESTPAKPQPKQLRIRRVQSSSWLESFLSGPAPPWWMTS